MLPTVHHPSGDPVSIQVDPGPFPGASVIAEGLFPQDLSEASPLERFEALIETALVGSEAFELIEQGPGESRSDAAYRLEFTVTEMDSEESRIGWFMSLLDQEKIEYIVVSIGYQLFNNYDDSKVGESKQVVDHLQLDYQNYRLPNHLSMRSYFDKLDRKMRPTANGTMRAIVRLVADVQDSIDAHRRSLGDGHVDRG